MPTNKQIIEQVLADDPANLNGYFALNLVFNAVTNTFDVYVVDQANPNHVALASQVPTSGTPLTGGIGAAALLPGVPNLSNPQFKQVYFNQLANGDNDLYTVPAGKRAIIFAGNAYNTTGVARTVRGQVKIGGTYYAISQGTSVSANATAGLTNQIVVVLEAGEILSVNVDAGAAVNFQYRILEFDPPADSSGLKSARLLTLGAGNNTLYTVAAGKQAITYNAQVNVSIWATNAGPAVSNRSGGARSVQSFLTPSGLAAIQFGNNAALANNNIAFTLGGSATLLTAGDAIIVATDAATDEQTAWLLLYEYTG